MVAKVVHSTVATLPDEVGAEVNKAEWNADHIITGVIDGAPGLDGEDGQDGPPGLPGAQGLQGTQGNPGPTGPTGLSTILVVDGQDGEDNLVVIPGPIGATGSQGIQGNPGTGGGTTIWLPTFDDPGAPEDMVVPEYQSDKNTVYLGRITGTGVTVGPLIWFDLFETILFKYQIGGYNGGTPVGRLLCGAAAISTTGLTNGNALVEGVTLNNTSVSKPGCPLAVTLSSIARSGWGYIRGESGALKQIDIHGMSGNPAVATAPLTLEARSFFSDLGTNLPIKRLQLTVYDTLIATAVSAQTFTATTYIEAWGIRKN